MLKQAVRILVDNAAKYTEKNDEILLSIGRNQEGHPYLQVQDTGMGMASADVEHMFERFYRVDKARSRKSGGSGLGLSIVRNMVERNGGKIEVERKVGEGSTFTLIFPVFDMEDDA